jgi:hypothetical protein
MSLHEHRRFRPYGRRDDAEGNAWDEVRITSVTRPMLSAPLISTVDWLDGDLGGDLSAPNGSGAPRGPREH